MSSDRQDPLVRMAHVVGDFGNPFYAEERQRDVWNEASAFGFQLVIWVALAVGTATVWLVGAPAVPYVGAVMVLLGISCGLTVAYAQHLGVELTGRDRMLRWRLLPYALLVDRAVGQDGGPVRHRRPALSAGVPPELRLVTAPDGVLRRRPDLRPVDPGHVLDAVARP